MQTTIWHESAVPTNVQEAMVRLANQEALDGLYLAGGTALALFFGHRSSRDLDFFRASFDEERALDHFLGYPGVSLISKARGTLHLHVGEVKVSFLEYPYPVLFPFEHFRGIPMADPRDIACMKLSAIAGRGSKRDFYDFYVLANEFGLAYLLDLFKSKYAGIDYNLVHVLKSLTYFEDADKEPTPNMLTEIPWEQVKAFFDEEAPRLI